MHIINQYRHGRAAITWEIRRAPSKMFTMGVLIGFVVVFHKMIIKYFGIF